MAVAESFHKKFLQGTEEDTEDNNRKQCKGKVRNEKEELHWELTFPVLICIWSIDRL